MKRKRAGNGAVSGAINGSTRLTAPGYATGQSVRSFTQSGWLLQPATSRMPYWCDVCQIGDAMFVPFIEALKARYAHRAADIEARACLRAGSPLIALDVKHGDADRRADTGLRVLGNPVWRYQASGVCVCETLVGDRIVLIYEPGALTRRMPLQEREEQL